MTLLHVYEKENSLIVQTDLPGLEAEDIDIHISGNTLIVEGDFESVKMDEHDNVSFTEYRSGKFRRTFTFPEYVNTDSVKAELDEGLLNLCLPKIKDAQPRKIEVKCKPSAE